jgi:hypothetical protein
MKEVQIGGVKTSSPETQEEMDGGSFGHLMNKISELGTYVPAEGYYKLIEVKNSPIHIDREIKQPVYAYFNAKSPNDFLEEKILFEARFLYNKKSIGDKNVLLKEGMIIHIKETRLVDAYYDGKPYQTYKIVWNIINSNTTRQVYSEDNMEYCEDYSQEELDDMYMDAFDGQEDAYWNID